MEEKEKIVESKEDDTKDVKDIKEDVKDVKEDVKDVKEDDVQKGDKEENNKEEIVEEKTSDGGVVENVTPVGNGIRLEDLITKDELTERLSALEAKLTAIVTENTKLKDELSNMKDKYETKDFGNVKKQGMIDKDENIEDDFMSYSKQFM